MAILIVEDEAFMRNMLCEVLSELAPCREAASAEEALRMMATESFDVVITDINLPGISGRELVQRMYTLHPASRIVVMSGAEMLAEDGWKGLGVRAYFLKPIDIDEIEDFMRRILDGDT